MARSSRGAVHQTVVFTNLDTYHSSSGFKSRPLPNVSQNTSIPVNSSNNNNENSEHVAFTVGSNRNSPARFEGKGVLLGMTSA